MDLSAFNSFDIAVTLIIAVSTLLAFFKGFLRTIFSFINWVGAVTVAYFLYRPIYAFFLDITSNEKIAALLSSGGVFFTVFILLAVLSSYLVNILNLNGFGFTDKTLGFAFGLVRGMVIIALLYLSITLSHAMLGLTKDKKEPGPEWLTSATTYNFVKISADLLLSFVPESVQKDIEKSLTQMARSVPTLEGLSSMATQGEKENGDSPAQRRLILKITSALPEEKIDELYDRYEGSGDNLSSLERKAVLQAIIAAYKEGVESGSIPKGDRVDPKDIKMLEEVLSHDPSERDIMKPEDSPLPADKIPETGYKKQQLWQLERLIETVE